MGDLKLMTELVICSSTLLQLFYISNWYDELTFYWRFVKNAFHIAKIIITNLLNYLSSADGDSKRYFPFSTKIIKNEELQQKPEMLKPHLLNWTCGSSFVFAMYTSYFLRQRHVCLLVSHGLCLCSPFTFCIFFSFWQVLLSHEHYGSSSDYFPQYCKKDSTSTANGFDFLESQTKSVSNILVASARATQRWQLGWARCSY